MALEANIPDPAQEAAQEKAKQAAALAKQRAAATPVQPCKACNNKCKELYEHHKEKVNKVKEKLTPEMQKDLDRFKANYEAHKDIYQRISDQTDVPPEVVAIQHWRESGGNFNTYLHQGDPLGKPPVHVPTNIPTFKKGEFEPAAVNALQEKGKKACQDALGMTKDTKDKAAMAAYLERWNGTGYYNKGVDNPYLYSGTDGYTSGKYVADHKYSATAVDKQLGAVPMMNAILPPDPPYQDDTLIPPKDSPLYNPAKGA